MPDLERTEVRPVGVRVADSLEKGEEALLKERREVLQGWVEAVLSVEAMELRGRDCQRRP
jgi:hypothetical protein